VLVQMVTCMIEKVSEIVFHCIMKEKIEPHRIDLTRFYFEKLSCSFTLHINLSSFGDL
jgi:hypothetical protein